MTAATSVVSAAANVTIKISRIAIAFPYTTECDGHHSGRADIAVEAASGDRSIWEGTDGTAPDAQVHLCDGPCDRSGRGDQHVGRYAKTSSYFGGRDDWTDFPACLPKSVLSRWRGRATPGPVVAVQFDVEALIA